ncbi:MAG: hypothetical protein ACI8U4_003264 [Natronomonas sp.]|jgi:hypothetical protein
MRSVTPDRRQLTVRVLLAIGLVATLGSGPILEQRALAAEEDYVAAQLEDESCLTDWGTREGAATQRAEVTGVSDEGIRVKVRLPYAYTTEQDGETMHADAVSEATYAVTRTDARRVRGDDISPC